MRFFEFEAREIVKRAGIPVTDYGFTTDPAEAQAIAERIGGPTVIKSQVLTGGRMKAGGVKFADTPEQAEAHARDILALEINGHMPRGVLVDPKAEVEQEYYAGVVWDGTRKQPVMIFSPVGGIDIEQVAEEQPDKVGRRHFSNILPLQRLPGQGGDRLHRRHRLGAEQARPDRHAPGEAVRRERHDARRDQPARAGSPTARSWRSTRTWTSRTRPAAATRSCSPTSASARRRRARRARRPRSSSPARRSTPQDHRGVAGNVTEFDGNLGLVIGAGGGSLTLFDAVRAHGGKPANYCEIGGNPSVAKACGLAKLVLQKPGVDKIAVMMSIVSNTRVDIVARGVIKACLELGFDPAEKIAIFRIPGAWEEEGFKILEKYGVDYADRSRLAQRGRPPRGREDPGRPPA